jgi:redoxin/copper type II ascorbate-dependent monooxygenase-like protein/EF hand domain-containing protein
LAGLPKDSGEAALKNHLIAATFAACTVLTALRGVAQQSPAALALEQRFKQLDKNGDGKITTDELPQSAFFKQRDINGDGVITLAEALAALQAGAGATPPPAAKKTKEPIPKVNKTPVKLPSTAVRQRPRPLKAGDHGVGRMVADASFTDLAGASYKLSSFSKQRAVVLAMTSTSCPLSKRYLPTLSNLASSNSQRGITWVLVNPIATDRSDDIQAAARSVEGNAIYVRDRDGALAKAVGALTTTDVIVLDASRTVVFHGAIDDQYGFGYALDAPKHSYLADALDAILANKQPRVAATEAPGCTLDSPDQFSEREVLTYHNRISRIVQTNCVECHREGGVAPFALTTHADVAAHAAMIKQVVQSGTMPPWFAASHEAEEERKPKSPSLWANDRSLAVAEKKDLFAWVDGGKQEGDERDAPQSLSFPKGWLIGTPDAVFEFPEPVPVKATGTMPYQNIVIETNLEEDKWVQAIEVQPGNRSVVHHMMVFLLSTEKERASASEEMADERSGFWAIYVPGNSTLIYPEGFAKGLPKGANLRCQVHYTTTGTATTDLSRVGVIYAKQPPQHEVRVVGIGNPRMAIPPGAENHREDGSLRLPFDIQVLSFLPHMHLRAKACRYKVVSPSGETRTLLDIPRYDFNWQLLYRYSQPQEFSRGDSIKFTAWYDNSANNPANPDPTQTVRWGKQTNDEMHLGYVEYFIPGLQPGEPLPNFRTPR